MVCSLSCYYFLSATAGGWSVIIINTDADTANNVLVAVPHWGFFYRAAANLVSGSSWKAWCEEQTVWWGCFLMLQAKIRPYKRLLCKCRLGGERCNCSTDRLNLRWVQKDRRSCGPDLQTCLLPLEKITKPPLSSSVLCTSLGSVRFLLPLLSQPGAFLGLFHLAKSPVVEDNLKAIHEVLNFGAFWNAMPAWCGSSCTAQIETKDGENNFHANHAFFLNTGCFQILRRCLEWLASEAVLGVPQWSTVVFHIANSCFQLLLVKEPWE